MADAHRLPLWTTTPPTRVSLPAVGASNQSAFVGEWTCTEAALLASLHSLILRSSTSQAAPATSALLEEADAVVKLYVSRLLRLALTVVESATAATTADAVKQLSSDWFEVQHRPGAHSTPSPGAPLHRRSTAGPSEAEQRAAAAAAKGAASEAAAAAEAAAAKAAAATPATPPLESVQSWMLPPPQARRVSPPSAGDTGGGHLSSTGAGRDGQYRVPVMMVGKPVFVPISPARSQLPHAGLASTPSRRASLGSPVPYVALLPPRSSAALYDRAQGGARRSLQEGNTVFPASSSRAVSPSVRHPSPGPTRVPRQSAPPQLAVGARPRDSSPSLAATEWLQERRARVSERALRAAWTVEQRRSQTLR